MLDKIITIIIVTIVLLLIEYGTYFLIRKISTKGAYHQGKLDDAYIYGLAIIVLIDLMLWYGVE